MAGRRRRLVFTDPLGLAVAEGGWGVALLLVSRSLLQRLAGDSVSPQVMRVARVLGARELMQGLVTARRPTRRALQLGGAADALHAMTMLAAAAADVGPRRLTIASATSAFAFSLVGLAQSRLR